MAKQFKQITLDPKKCRAQITEFGALLTSKTAFSEKHDIQPFFKKRSQISAFIGSYMRDTGPATHYAFEYPFYGDFAADLVVGDKAARRFCVIEFEDGRKDSIFKVPKGKSTAEWSQRFEHGFSQIVDWFTLINDIKKTSRFQKDFGQDHIRFSAPATHRQGCGCYRVRTRQTGVENGESACRFPPRGVRHIRRPP